jgi:hypothetical protein
MGQVLLKPLVKPILYEKKDLKFKTILEFNLEGKDVKSPHKFDHVK